MEKHPEPFIPWSKPLPKSKTKEYIKNDPSVMIVIKKTCVLFLRVETPPTNPPQQTPRNNPDGQTHGFRPCHRPYGLRRQGAVMLGFTTVAKCFSRSFHVVSAVSPPILGWVKFEGPQGQDVWDTLNTGVTFVFSCWGVIYTLNLQCSAIFPIDLSVVKVSNISLGSDKHRFGIHQVESDVSSPKPLQV